MKVKEERDRLEGLLDGTPDSINGEVPVPGDIPEELQSQPTMGINFAELKQTCEDEARVMLNNSIGFILSEEVIADNAYLKTKLEVDIMSLSGMLYQVRVNESMQLALMNEVDRGFIHPRMFEVFSGLSKTIAEINKQLIGTVEAIKSTYKEVKIDYNEKQHELGTANSQQGITQGEQGVVSMGTKDLIKQIKYEKSQQAREEREAEDVEILPIGTPSD